MGLFSTLRQALFGTSAAAVTKGAAATSPPASAEIAPPASAEIAPPASPDVAKAGADASSEAVAARQRRAAERLVDDERLRGGLTDVEFQPLLDWALAAVDRAAAATAGQPDDRADASIEATITGIRDTVSAVDSLVENAGPGTRSKVAKVIANVFDAKGPFDGSALVTRLAAVLTRRGRGPGQTGSRG